MHNVYPRYSLFPQAKKKPVLRAVLCSVTNVTEDCGENFVIITLNGGWSYDQAGLAVQVNQTAQLVDNSKHYFSHVQVKNEDSHSDNKNIEDFSLHSDCREIITVEWKEHGLVSETLVSETFCNTGEKF